MSSFFALGHVGLEDETLKRAVNLAEDGRIAHALVLWKKHKDAHGSCLCDDIAFDQVRCGFCFAGKLWTLDLFEGHLSRPVPYGETARAVQDFAKAKKAAQPIQT